MIVADKNQTLFPPVNAFIQTVSAEGAYLRLEYWRIDSDRREMTVLVVYLNDMGREVLRTEEIRVMESPAEDDLPASRSWTYRFKNGFYIALLGLQEMIQCLNEW